MKNKCEICRCLLFEADVWSALPESNQLFPLSCVFSPPPPTPNVVQELFENTKGRGNVEQWGIAFLLQLPNFSVT